MHRKTKKKLKTVPMQRMEVKIMATKRTAPTRPGLFCGGARLQSKSAVNEARRVSRSLGFYKTSIWVKHAASTTWWKQLRVSTVTETHGVITT